MLVCCEVFTWGLVGLRMRIVMSFRGKGVMFAFCGGGGGYGQMRGSGGD